MADRLPRRLLGDPDSMRLPLALFAAALTASCSLLPPSLRKGEAAAPVEIVIAPSEQGAEAKPKAGQSNAAAAKLYPGTGNFVAQKPAGPAPLPGPEEASLNFEALDVREVAKVILGDYLKQSYTVHPAVAGTVTFRTIRPIPMRDLLPTLEMLLRQNNAAVVVEDSIYKILPLNQVRGSVSPQLGGSTRPIPAGFSVMVVPLKYIGAREMQKLLEPFAADNTIRIDEVRNMVIIAGGQRELRHLVDTIDLFDVDWLAGYSVGLFPIKTGDVKSMVGDLDRVFGQAGSSPLAGVVRVIPIERMNALLVVTTQPRYLEMAQSWVERIDQAGGASGATRFFVYQVRNGKAENLAQLIGDLFASGRRSTTTNPSLAPGARPAQIGTAGAFGQSTQTTTTTVGAPASAAFQIPGASGTTGSEVRVIADKDTNSLLILATPSDYDVIESALRKLDVIPRQVLVEVMLAEVTLNDNFNLGLGWFINGRNNTNGQVGVGLGANPQTAPGAPLFNGNATTGALQLIQRATDGDIRVVLNALGQDGKAKILASPQVMVLDNQKAQIKVGSRISVQTSAQTGVSTGTGVLNSFQYLDTGILLAVTPRINSGGLVTLDVNQEVSVPDSASITSGNPNPTVNSRSAQTSVVVASGESIVLGGLIREDTTSGTSGLPLLSKIPILGAAFGAQNFQRVRTELVLVITPRIISDSEQAREATDELRKKLPALENLLPKHKDTPPPVRIERGAAVPATAPPVQVIAPAAPAAPPPVIVVPPPVVAPSTPPPPAAGVASPAVPPSLPAAAAPVPATPVPVPATGAPNPAATPSPTPPK